MGSDPDSATPEMSTIKSDDYGLINGCFSWAECVEWH